MGKMQKKGGKTFLGECWGSCEMPKKGWKNFLVVPKSGGNFCGGHSNFLGRIFREKKTNPRGDSLEN